MSALKGRLSGNRPAMQGSGTTIVLALEDGSLEQRILEGRYKLKIGTDYRFYLKREPIAEIQIELPEILQPAIIVLGHEELPFSSGKQI